MQGIHQCEDNSGVLVGHSPPDQPYPYNKNEILFSMCEYVYIQNFYIESSLCC